MNLSQIIREIEYWHRQLSAQWTGYRRVQRAGRIKRAWHRAYCRRVISNIRDWQAQYDACLGK